MWAYFIDDNPTEAARCLCDEHLVHPDERLIDVLSRRDVLSDHPLSAWVGQSPANWQWLLHYVIAKEAEREWRNLGHDSPIVHEYLEKFRRVMPHLCKAVPATVASPLLVGEWTGFPRIMPREHNWPEDCVEAWRLFYFREYHRGEWTRRTPPQWFVRF